MADLWLHARDCASFESARIDVAHAELVSELLIVLWPLLDVAFLTPLLHCFLLSQKRCFLQEKALEITKA